MTQETAELDPKTGKAKKEDTLKDFLYNVQKNRDRKDVDNGILIKEKEERKNILNLRLWFVWIFQALFPQNNITAL